MATTSINRKNDIRNKNKYIENVYGNERTSDTPNPPSTWTANKVIIASVQSKNMFYMNEYDEKDKERQRERDGRRAEKRGQTIMNVSKLFVIIWAENFVFVVYSCYISQKKKHLHLCHFSTFNVTVYLWVCVSLTVCHLHLLYYLHSHIYLLDHHLSNCKARIFGFYLD